MTWRAELDLEHNKRMENGKKKSRCFSTIIYVLLVVDIIICCSFIEYERYLMEIGMLGVELAVFLPLLLFQ
jgi:hypothetical protein